MNRRWYAALIGTVTMLAIISLAGQLAFARGDSDEPCTSCAAPQDTLLAQDCPFTEVIYCWCETPPDWVCCLFMRCEPTWGGGCNDRWFFEDCFQCPCGGPYPTFAEPR